MANNPYYPVDLSVPLQPGQPRDVSRDVVLKKIQDVLNFLLSQSSSAQPTFVTSITDTDQVPPVPAAGPVNFSGAGVSQAGNDFIFAGGGGGGGTVTSVGATAPLQATPSPIVSAGVISHKSSGVTPAVYTNPSIDVDMYGHILSAASGSSSIAAANAFGHTVTADVISLWLQTISSGDTIQGLPRLVGGADRGILAIYVNRSVGTITVFPFLGETVNGGASFNLIAGQGATLIGLAGAASTGDWGKF